MSCEVFKIGEINKIHDNGSMKNGKVNYLHGYRVLALEEEVIKLPVR